MPTPITDTLTLTNRLHRRLPKIGIRPTIDGRYGGVRESLEGQTMTMARNTAQLLQENLRHACGLPVEVVISETCIGNAAEAARCEELFSREGVGLSLTVTPCWCYGSETMDMHPTRPKAVWGFNGTERPGAVYLAAVLSAHAQKGLPAFGIYGREVQNSTDTPMTADVIEKIFRFCRAGLAAASMSGTSYLAMGGVSMGIAGSIVSPDFLQDYLGMRAEFVDMTEFARRMDKGIYDPDEYARALTWVKEHCPEGRDTNPPDKQRTREQKDADWATCVKMALIARDLMNGNPRLAELGHLEEACGHDALAGGFQGQRQWTDYYPNGDFLEAILTTGFDWNGPRQPYMIATENDHLNGISMLWGHLLTMGEAQLFADVRTYWSPEAVRRVTGHTLEGVAEGGILHLINSGPAALEWTGEMHDADGQPTLKPWYAASAEDTARCLGVTQWCASDLGYFPGGGWSTDFTTRGGLPMTIFRLNLVKGLGPVLQIAEGYSVELPEVVHEALDERTNPTWPTTWFAPRVDEHCPLPDVYAVMNAWGANHCAAAYGHIGADLIALAAMLRVPVEMHNVPSDQVFRPAMWQRFGGMTETGADYRACQTMGPLYR